MATRKLKDGKPLVRLGKRVALTATALCMAAASPVRAADRTISSDYTLSADETVDGVLTVAAGATLDLNGHTLRVAALAGAGSIVDSGQGQYELLDFILSDGNQGITTDLVPDANTKVDVVFTPMLTSTGTLFGTKWGASGFLAFATGGTWYGLFNTTVGTISAGSRYRFTVDSGTAVLENDETGANVGTKGNVNMSGSNQPLGICKCGSGSPQYGSFKIHSFKVWHENDMRFDFVPARSIATGDVGLLNRLDGTLHTSDTGVEFLAGPATGNLLISATSEAALANFSGTVASTVSMSLEGEYVLSADADWRRFPTLRIDGTVDLAGHDLSLSDFLGTGGITDSSKVYEHLEYVESANAQRVLTGIVPSTDTAIEMDVTLTKIEASKFVFGCNWGKSQYLMISTNSKFQFFGAQTTICSQTAGKRYRISITPTTSPNGTATAIDVDTGATLGSVSVNLTNNSNAEMTIFDELVTASPSRAGAFRLHSFKITKGGELMRDFVPVHDLNSGKVGLLDNVSGDVFVSNTGTDLIGGPVVASEGHAGRLHVDVPESHTVKTEWLALSGSLTLVKDGKGTLVANRTGQTYAGGTRIEDGCVEAMCKATSTPLGVKGDSENAGPDIIVGSGAVFDFKGNVDYRWYNIVLDGGTLRNGGSDQAQRDGSLGHLTLTADSTIETLFNTTVFHARTDLWNLDTHTLSVETRGKTLYFRDPVNITNGVFWLKGDGCWQTYDAVNMRGATLRAESALWLGAKLDVDDYYAACTNNVNNGTAAMNVYGRFTPATDYFYGCALQDGVTLDLNGRSGAWSTTSAFTTGSNRVTFASGATITIDVHARTQWGGKIVDWGEGNMPTGVTFRLDGESKARGRALRVRGDGLYAVGGVMIIIR